jgi:hypothetical protein
MEECYPIVYRCCAGFKEHLRLFLGDAHDIFPIASMAGVAPRNDRVTFFHSYAAPRNDSENMYPIRCSFYKRQSREAFVQFCAAPRNEKNNIFPILALNGTNFSSYRFEGMTGI